MKNKKKEEDLFIFSASLLDMMEAFITLLLTNEK